MTRAQMRVRSKQIADTASYEDRAFRKGCVTQGIVTILKEDCSPYYVVWYRGRYVTILFGDDMDSAKLRVMWNIVRVSEQFVRELKELKHESK